MSSLIIGMLKPSEGVWPEKLSLRLGASAPRMLRTMGSTNLLVHHKVGLSCSTRAPGDAILRAYETVQKLRDDGVTIIGGFHSPIEKDCLEILLRGKQPIIICLARAMENIRLPAAWRAGIDAGRLLIVSPFEKRSPRPTVESAVQRNELVAALADEVLIIHAARGRAIERISELINRWGVPTRQLD